VHEKENINWKKKLEEFKKLIKKSKNNPAYDCIVPCSGGKDGTYVSNKIKSLGYNPLMVTVRPHLETDIGKNNLYNFLETNNVAHHHITIPYEVMRKFNKLGLIYKGSPYYGWLLGIHTAVIRLALDMNIGLIIYGEDGELEYGGTTKNKNKTSYNYEYIKNEMIEGDYNKILKKSGYNFKETYLLRLPPDSEIKKKKLKFAHWSYFENWDPYRNYMFAKKNSNLQEQKVSNVGTFTNFAQNDQALFALHMYLMYLKFGFGRATQDVGIEIRRGAMTRSQGINLVKMYDYKYSKYFLKDYLEYYQMKEKELVKVIDKWVNKKLFTKTKNGWKPKFQIK
tara:strand:+ start:2067 stop:3080 length:1014 start_codon:yes stop_codon:yes gene_type:complete